MMDNSEHSDSQVPMEVDVHSSEPRMSDSAHCPRVSVADHKSPNGTTRETVEDIPRSTGNVISANDDASAGVEETGSASHLRHCEAPSSYTDTLGVSVEELPAMKHDARLPQLRESESVVILFDLEDKQKHPAQVPAPYPEKNKLHRFHPHYVRMPYHTENWHKIEACLRKLTSPIASFHEVPHIIKQYTSTCDADFLGLLEYFSTKVASDTPLSPSCLLNLIPKIAALALELPNICTRQIPLLRRQKNFLLAISQYQAACLLANAFFCTFPPVLSVDLVHLNFLGLYQQSYDRSSSQFAKLDCIFNYFRRVTASMPTGIITFRRQVLNDRLKWRKSGLKLIKELRVSCNGRIEKDAPNMLHVDFANKCVGGGMLGHGCVQEEILFMLCPELIVSRLVTEVLGDKETLVITGHQRFNDYRGYAWSFKWNGDYVDTTSCDAWGRHTTQLVAMDAQVLWDTDVYDQLSSRCLKRELNKAFCGFQCSEYEQMCTVATGNWGCGAFGGDPGVKFLVQLMAASLARRPLFYFTFDDFLLGHLVFEAHQAAITAGWSVGDLWKYMDDMACKYGHDLSSERLLQGIVDQVNSCNKSQSSCIV